MSLDIQKISDVISRWSFDSDCHYVLIPYSRKSGGLVSLEIRFLSNCHVNCPRDRATIMSASLDLQSGKTSESPGYFGFRIKAQAPTLVLYIIRLLNVLLV